MSEVEGAVPAQPEATPAPVLTAVESAVAKDDFTAYRDTRRAERSGTPAPAPVAEPVAEVPPVAAAAPVEEPRQVSKRQNDINERIRLATERATSELAAENARLRAQLPAPVAAPRTEPPVGETFPNYATYLEKHPDASLEDYIDARQDFRDEVKARSTNAQRIEAEQTRSQEAQIQQARERVAAARQADPEFDAKIAPELLTLETREASIANRRIPLAENDFATEISKSEYLPQILLHVSQHPELMTQIRGLDTRRAVMKFVAKLETRFEKADAAPVVQPPKTISSAPTPGTALGSRPASASDPVVAAVKAGDVSAYRAARMAERESARR